MGVPQGPVLGPVLFIIYVNTVSTAISYRSFTIYADNLSLIMSSTSDIDLKAKCND